MGNYCCGTCAYDGSLVRTGSRGLRVVQGGLSSSLAPSQSVSQSHRVLGLAILCAVLTLVLAWCATDRAIANHTAELLAQARYETVVVHPGDTLWGLVQAHGTGGCDTRAIVGYVRQINGLDSASLQVGAELTIPIL